MEHMEHEEKLLGTGRIHTDTYKEQAYDLIKDAILFNRFQTDTTYSQEAICTELGISRTPVREALLELQKEGFICFCRGKGIRIVPVTEKNARDILEMRIFLEEHNARLASVRAEDAEIEAIMKCLCLLKDELSSHDSHRLYRIDHTFHRLIAAATHNGWMEREINTILDNYLRFEIKSVYADGEHAQTVLKEHLDIGEAIKARNPKLAVQAMNRHLTNSYKRTLSQVWS